MANGFFWPPKPRNEPVLDYAPGSPERAVLKARLAAMAAEEVEIPLIIDGEEVRTGRTAPIVMPHDRRRRLGVFHRAGPAEVERAVAGARRARAAWAALPWEERAAVFLKAADLLAGPWRATVNAATMLGQSKTVHQAEIDAACELIDFFRFNVYYAGRIYAEQPDNAPGMWNRLDYRPLDGFVFAVTPFNFTSIGGNLPTAPALMGNTVLWKPASTAVLSNYYVMRLLQAAGLPPGVIQFLPGSGAEVGDPVLNQPELAGLHFTGSTATFQGMWRRIGENIARYRQYPRLVGETGGKDFVVAHPSADPEALVTALVRGAFEYQGQKCSAASRAYLPRSLWPDLAERLRAAVAAIGVGDVTDFRNFMGAVIDEASYRKLSRAIAEAREAPGVEIVTGGKTWEDPGWFVAPTILRVEDPHYRTMEEELFGPILSVFVYEDTRYPEILELCDRTSPYGLTGSIFATDRAALALAQEKLRFAAGNFYLNDKPTGAVVGQQPFGGSRASGTNDKAGSYLNLLRWTSPRTIKETFDPPRDFRYPFMAEE